MHTVYHPQPLKYTGHQLRSHWIFDTFGLQGDAIVAFQGPCEVALTEMVDLEDAAVWRREAGSEMRETDSSRLSSFASPRQVPIAAASMVHFIAEHFDRDLEKAVLRQRLFICMIAEALARRHACESGSKARPAVRREGDDLYAGDRKLSISIATVSPVSTLMHVGLNLDPSGAPVPAVGLDEWGVDAEALARELLDAYASELADVHLATCKVRGVQ